MLDASQSKARLGALIAIGAIAALLVALAAPNQAHAQRVVCNGTFRVLHDDRVGNLELPRGNYRITTLASGMPSCAQSAALFSRFLEDYDGKLPGGWRVAAAQSTFLREPGYGFHVVRVGGGNSGGGGGTGGEESEAGGGGAHPFGGNVCPGTFRVMNNDRIGGLRLPRGPYWVFLLQRQGLNCAQASRLFANFLQNYDGILPAPWILEPHTATFRSGATGVGFRVKSAR